MCRLIRVGMADLNVCRAPDGLTTLGLGSCVGVALYDEKSKIAGMVHVMLPDSTKHTGHTNPAKFADTGIAKLVEEMTALGASKNRLTAKIAGGASMFAFKSENELLQIGNRNVEAVKQVLKKLGIRLLSEDTGSNYGRTIEFDSDTGMLTVKAIGKEVKKI